MQTTFTFASGREQGCSQSQISLIQLKGRDGLKAGISDCRASRSPVPSSCCRRAPRASLPGRAPLPSLRGSQNRFLVLSLPAIFPRLSDTSHLLGKWTLNTRLFSQDVFPKILAPISHALLAPRCLQANFSFINSLNPFSSRLQRDHWLALPGLPVWKSFTNHKYTLL